MKKKLRITSPEHSRQQVEGHLSKGEERREETEVERLSFCGKSVREIRDMWTESLTESQKVLEFGLIYRRL